MDRTSFYGGMAGQSFEIKEIFKNKKEMLADLQQRWQSPIGITDFVVISYGLPGKDEDDFLTNQQIDTTTFGKSYNSTLWQKIYTENDQTEINELRDIETYYVSGEYGLGYKLIASMSGNTPRSTLYTKIIHSYETPYWKFYDYYDSTYPETENAVIDRPVIIAFLPIAQRIEVKKVALDSQDDPVFIWDTTTNSYTNPDDAAYDKTSQDIDRTQCGTIKDLYDNDHNAIIDGNDRPILWLGIPPGWGWDLDYDTLAADQDPVVDLSDDGNAQTLKIRLPRTWKWILDKHVLNAEDDPIVNLLSDASIDTKTLQIDIPRPWSWNLNYSLSDANQNPTVNLNHNENTQTLTITLPRAWKWGLTGDDPLTHLFTILSADQHPEVVLTNDGNIQYLEFKLPQAQVMDDPDTNTVAPMTNPSVTLNDDNINEPKLIFNLPRAVRFYYGGLLGKRSAGTYTLSVAEVANYAPGDYYINQGTGFIYIITDNASGTVTFQYVACLQMPPPLIDTTAINPYTANGATKVNPSVTSTFDNPTELTGWKLNFNLPKLPDFSITHELIGAGENGDVTLIPNDVDNVNFHVKLPQGSRMFAGIEVEGDGQNDVLNATVATDPIVGDPLPGDLYLNTNTGKVYKLDRTGVWKYQNEGLKGAVGDALNIVREYTLTIDTTTGFVDNLTNGVNYIKAHYLEDDGVTPKPYAPDEIFAITWIDPNNNNKETSYWYFYTEDNKWGRVQVTGGVLNLIENNWVESPEDNPVTTKTYSIDYINKLIGGNITVDNADKTTFSKDQIYALFGWGSFSDAESGQWWPETGTDKNTLSAEEILALLSWGDFASLALTS